MKKTNKGFSLVELIIVIAIMAILAGALAPALIKYINKSRASAAISNAQQIATSVQAALSNVSVYDQASDVSLTAYSSWNDAVASEVQRTVGKTRKHKAKKDLKGSPVDQEYYVELHLAPGSGQEMLKVWAGDSDDSHLVYPTIGDNWVD